VCHFGNRGFPLGLRGTCNGGVDIEIVVDRGMNIDCAWVQGLTMGVSFPAIEIEVHMLECQVPRKVIEKEMEPAQWHRVAFHLLV
jgi:hypothetical protein